jgi:thymidylate synthase
MNNLDKVYQALLQDILDNGVEKQDRTGTGTISVFGRQIRHKMSEGYPLLTTKKMAFKTMVTELLWFLKGDTNIKYLVDNGCRIWDGDAYKRYKSTNPDYLTDDEMFKTERGTYKFFTQEEFINKIKTDDEFAKKWGELGPVYGAQWRAFDEEEWGGIDQIQNLITDLKTNPDSRRLMVTAWNPSYQHQMVLPPCHYGFQIYTREENGQRYISLMWNQRSVDTFLGLPFNIASYGLLLEMIAKEVNMVPDELIGNLGDVHLYSNHIEQAKEQITRTPMTLPTVEITELDLLKGSVSVELKNYIHHDPIKAPLSN